MKKTDSIVDLTQLKPSSRKKFIEVGNGSQCPVFSVCIPAYNAKNTIQQCIESVLNQTFQDFEVVVVDDCSTDGQWDILLGCFSKNKKLRIFRNKSNIGTLGTRTHAIVNSRGKYVISLDSDDTLQPYALQNLYDFYMATTDIDIVQYCVNTDREDIEKYFNSEFSSLENQNEVRQHFAWGLYPRQDSECHNVIAKSYKGQLARAVSASILDSVMETKSHVELIDDVLLNTIVSWNASSCVFFEKKLYNYSLGGISTNVKSYMAPLDLINIKGGLTVLQTFLKKYHIENELIYQIKRFLLNECFWKIKCASENFINVPEKLVSHIHEVSKLFGHDMVKNYLFEKLHHMSFKDIMEELTRWLPFLIEKPAKRKIKTVAIYYYYIAPAGGIETFIETAIKFFKKMSYNVILITATQPQNIKIDVSESNVVFLPNANVSWDNINVDSVMEYEERLKKVLIENEVDLFYTQDYAHWITIFDLITANECGCHTILHFHNNPFAMKRVGSMIWETQLRYMKYFDYCISLSKSAKWFFEQIGICNEYIPNLISSSIQKKIGIYPTKDKTIDILWVGRLCQAKGIDKILDVLKEIHNIYPRKHLKIKIIGSWYQDCAEFECFKTRFLKEIRALNDGINFEIDLAEEYDKEKIYMYMQTSKVLLYTSVFDGFPYVIAESLANGLPIVAYSQPEIELFKCDAVYQFNDVRMGACMILNVLEMTNDKYYEIGTKCKKYMQHLYNTDEIRSIWNRVMKRDIFQSTYGRPGQVSMEMVMSSMR